MKSVKLLPDQAPSKTNGCETSVNDGRKNRDVRAKNPERRQREKKNLDALKHSKDIASMRNLVDMTIHEIRNPLTAISLANQSLREQIEMEDLPESIFACTAIIQKNISVIEKMLKDMLNTNAVKRSVVAPTDVCFAIENSLCRVNDRIFLKKLDVSKSYSPGLLVYGNAEELSVAFLNIIVNAIEAVKEAEGKIWITAYRIREKVKVIFKDNGAGMEPEVADQMFNKNFSVKSEGLGVGLSYVKEILDWHNASVSVNSEPGTGTTILIEFDTI